MTGYASRRARGDSAAPALASLRETGRERGKVRFGCGRTLPEAERSGSKYRSAVVSSTGPIHASRGCERNPPNPQVLGEQSPRQFVLVMLY